MVVSIITQICLRHGMGLYYFYYLVTHDLDMTGSNPGVPIILICFCAYSSAYFDFLLNSIVFYSAKQCLCICFFGCFNGRQGSPALGISAYYNVYRIKITCTHVTTRYTNFHMKYTLWMQHNVRSHLKKMQCHTSEISYMYIICTITLNYSNI